MSKKINNIIIFALVFIGIMLLGVVITLPTKTDAYLAQGGYIAGATSASAENLVPVISIVTPDTRNTNSKARTIEIYGANFVPTSVAKFDGSPRPMIFNHPGHLTMQIYDADMKIWGTHLITVTNPAPGGGISNVKAFSVTGNTAFSNTSDSNSNGNGTNGNDNRNENNGSVLGASAVNSGFLPSSLLQWLFLAILILLGVILWRKNYEEKNKKTPLKHA